MPLLRRALCRGLEVQSLSRFSSLSERTWQTRRAEAEFAVFRFIVAAVAEDGKVSEGLAVVDEVSDRSEERWLIPELLRLS